MRVKPEKMLEKNRVAAEPRIEDADAREPLQRHEHDRDGDHRRSENENDTRRIHRPDKKRKPEPRQSRRAHLVNRDNKVQARHDG